MHPEQVEAIAEQTIERHLGDVQTLQNLQAVLQRTNLRMVPAGESDAPAKEAKLIQSLFISHTNLARVAGNLADAMQRLQERIAILESTIPPLQEAVINLQLRLKSVEDHDPSVPHPTPDADAT